MPFIVELEDDVFLAPGYGDPPRTTLIDSAKLFRNQYAANLGIGNAREYRTFSDAKIVPVRVRVEKL